MKNSHGRTFPAARKSDQVDVIHGHEVRDPYRWLEDDSEERKKWLAAQSKSLTSFLKRTALRESIKARVTAARNDERITNEIWRGERHFFLRNSGLQKHPMLYVQDKNASPRLLLDPNGWSKDGAIALRTCVISPDGKTLAYSYGFKGKDEVKWRLHDVDSGLPLPDLVHSEPVWAADSKGYYYTDSTTQTTGEGEHEIQKQIPRLWLHTLGTEYLDDSLITTIEDEDYWSVDCEVNGRYIVLSSWLESGGTARSWIVDLSTKEKKAHALFGGEPCVSNCIGAAGNVLWFHTHLGAPRGKIVAVKMPKPGSDLAPRVSDVVVECADTLESVHLVADKLVAHYLVDGLSSLKIFDRQGRLQKAVSLPYAAVATSLRCRKDGVLAFEISNLVTPAQTMQLYVESGLLRKIPRCKPSTFDASQYEMKRLMSTSPDGTKVPVFVAHKRGIELDGSHPTLLYGYGGFRVNVLPGAGRLWFDWLRLGGIIAIACIRGGMEYGEAWHQAGTRQDKQNVFDDFIGAAEQLISAGYTSSEKLAINGASNGGLLVGACINQRPDLFAAAIPEVGVLDMIRYEEFGGENWIENYGTVKHTDEFEALLDYSPVHTVEDGVEYPATLVITGDSDLRVSTAHSYKYTAALQAAQAGKSPILLRVNPRSGHGHSMAMTLEIEESTDVLTFLCSVLKVDVA